MSRTSRIIALSAAIAMLVFSGWMFLRTGDWIALIFVAGSLAYIALFAKS